MKRYRILFLLLGFFLLAVLIYRTGLQLILSYIGMIGWRFILIIGVAFCWQLGNTIAWGLAFERKVAPPFGIQFFAKLGGDAINHITPLLNLGGEFVKPYLIRSHTPIPAGFASIIITKTLQAVAGVIYALVGLSLAFFIFDLPAAAWLTMGLFLATGSAFVVWLLVQQQKDLFSTIRDRLSRFNFFSFPAEVRGVNLHEMDSCLVNTYRHQRLRLGTAVLFHGVSWIFGVLETWLIAHCLDEPISLGTAFFLTSLSSVINTAFFFVPGGIGVWEGGQAILFALLGLPLAAGLTVGLIKRIRKLFYVLAGLLMLSGWIIKPLDVNLKGIKIN